MWLSLSDQAEDDLQNIAFYIAEQSGSGDVAHNFVQKIVAKCEELASIKGIIGVARDELMAGLRSHPFGNYVIFFRYKEDCFEVITIVEGHRDIGIVFPQDDFIA